MKLCKGALHFKLLAVFNLVRTAHYYGNRATYNANQATQSTVLHRLQLKLSNVSERRLNLQQEKWANSPLCEE
jgi:hypothetical protein